MSESHRWITRLETPTIASLAEVEVAQDLVSVLVATHNGALTIRRALESVLNGDYRTVEVLVVDDGSTDDTPRIVAEMAQTDNRIRLIQRPVPSGGPAAPRTLALRLATGEFIALLDQDDYWLPERLSQQMRVFSEQDVALVYSDAWVVDHSSSIPAPDARTLYSQFFDLEPCEGDVREDLVKGNFVPALTAVVRQRWVPADRSFGRNGQTDLCDDYDFWLQVAFAGGRFAAVRAPLAVYVLHDANLGRTQLTRMYAECEKAIRLLLVDHPSQRSLIKPRLRRMRRESADHSLRRLARSSQGWRQRLSNLPQILRGPPTGAAIYRLGAAVVRRNRRRPAGSHASGSDHAEER